jgi:hypothetical protein
MMIIRWPSSNIRNEGNKGEKERKLEKKRRFSSLVLENKKKRNVKSDEIYCTLPRPPFSLAGRRRNERE